MDRRGIRHRGLVPARPFHDLRVGEEFPLPSRTVTEAHFANFQAISGDNHPIHYDFEYCRALGHNGLLAHAFQVLSYSAAGAGVFADVMGPGLVGFIEQSSRFLRPVYPGDTLYPLLRIAELQPQRSTAVVVLDSEIDNQRGERVMEGRQSYLVRIRPPVEDRSARGEDVGTRNL